MFGKGQLMRMWNLPADTRLSEFGGDSRDVCAHVCVWRPADYLGALPGLPSLLHELPQLNTSYSLLLSSVLVFCFYLAPTDRLPRLFLGDLVSGPSLFSLHVFLLGVFPGAVPTSRLPVRGFRKASLDRSEAEG